MENAFTFTEFKSIVDLVPALIPDVFNIIVSKKGQSGWKLVACIAVKTDYAPLYQKYVNDGFKVKFLRVKKHSNGITEFEEF